MSLNQKPLPKPEWIGTERLAREGLINFPFNETMKENSMEKKEETPLAEKVLQLYRELLAAKKDKLESAKIHTEEIKRIEAEIKDLLKDEKEKK